MVRLKVSSGLAGSVFWDSLAGFCAEYRCPHESVCSRDTPTRGWRFQSVAYEPNVGQAEIFLTCCSFPGCFGAAGLRHVLCDWQLKVCEPG